MGRPFCFSALLRSAAGQAVIPAHVIRPFHTGPCFPWKARPFLKASEVSYVRLRAELGVRLPAVYLSLSYRHGLCLVVLLGIVLFFSAYCSACRPRRGSVEWIALRERRTRRGFSLPLHPMERRDALPLLLITVLYAFSAFFRLGSLSAPQSALDLGDNGSVELELSEQVYLTKLMYFSNLGTGSYNLEVSADGETWYTLWARKDEEGDVTGYYWADAEGYSPSYALPQKYNDLFKWLEIEPENPQNVRYLRLTGKADKGLLELGELALYSAVGESRDPLGRLNVSPAPLSARNGTDLTGITVSGADALFDEQDTVPAQSTWYNSAYFDEIYHARTALEHLEGVYPYEVSHPPLGKLIIGLGIRVFGMTPFGWRFMGTLFGVCMLPILYVFLKNLFGRTAVAACGTCLFAFDFMHLTQTRIATIDTYGVFFILLMYFFLYRYLTLPAGTPFRRGALPLFLSGLFWGIGAASKWTVIYGAAGLAVLYFIGLHAKWRAWPVGEQAPRFAPWLVKTLLLSALCFVAIPACIYCLSYLLCPGQGGGPVLCQHAGRGAGKSAGPHTEPLGQVHRRRGLPGRLHPQGQPAGNHGRQPVVYAHLP